MKTVRVLAVSVAAAVCICTSSFADGFGNLKADTAVRLRAFMPQQEEDWDSAIGAEIQARFWSDGNIGVALSLGIDTWQARNEYSEQSDDVGTIASSIYGSMTLLPVGASVLFRNQVGSGLAVILEAGVRYVFTDSNLNAEITYTDASGETFSRDRIYCDRPFLGVVGVTLEGAMSEDISFHLGLGYQFDLTRPHETFMGEDAGVTSFTSPMVNLGLSWSF